jgi:hypothetical protein
MRRSSLGSSLRSFPVVLGMAILALTTSAYARSARSNDAGNSLTSAMRDSIAPVPFERDTMSGESGKLWIRLVDRTRSAGIAALRRLFGDSAAFRPGVYTMTDSLTGKPFSFVNLVPFSDKQRGALGTYRMGRWPAERRAPRSEAYENPEGFIPVTADNQDTPVSEHFRLRDFLTHDQGAVWPKYLVLSEALVDKLELTINALRERGIAAQRLVVMSGFRTPQYNAKGVGRKGGRAEDSRHQYGDAADVFVDDNGDGRMDDLNHDGRVNSRDAKLLAQVVQTVEDEHTDLVGGMGIYSATRAHGPFVHVDVRGVPARWGIR